MIRFFHIENVSKSNQITDQETFIEPYGIQSVLAAGTQFFSGAAYVLIGFSKQTISYQDAEKLIRMAPHLSTLLSFFDSKNKLWSS